ncbi:MAG: DUF2029 domain-containing protein [Bacteroidia bacterium]
MQNLKDHWLYLIAILTVVIVSRLPFLSDGFGLDNDAWRIANSGSQWLLTGEYIASRLPGYPLHEVLSGVLKNSTYAWHNAIAVLHSGMLAIMVFFIAVQKVSAREAFFIALAILFIPVVWINSTVNMDYIPATAWVLASILALLANRPVLAGIILGIATGFRITSSIYGLAYVFYFRKDLKSLLKAGAAAFGVACLFYSFPFYQYGWSFFSFTPIKNYPNWDKFLIDTPLQLFGVFELMAFFILALKSFKKTFKSSLNELEKVLLTTAMLCIALYVYQPIDIDYLIPAVVLLGLFVFLRNGSYSFILMSVLLVSSLFLRLNQSAYETYKAIGRSSDFVELVDLKGEFLSFQKRRTIQMQHLYSIEKQLSNKDGVFITGILHPKAKYLFKAQNKIILEEIPNEDTITAHLQKGRKCYSTSKVLEWLRRSKHIDLTELEISILE